MKILLIGEYSSLHASLAKGLRLLGHDVVVASNGDFWKNYPRDIDLSRSTTKIGGLLLWAKLLSLLPRWRNFDVIQLINPLFAELKADKLKFFFNYLKQHNKKIFLLGAGMDYYWVQECCNTMPLRYSDFNIGTTLRTHAEAQKEIADWIGTEKELLNKYIAQQCNGIITCLYEYQVCYQPHYPDKTHFIPLPIDVLPNQDFPTPSFTPPLKIFIGINKQRNVYKGTDIMLKAAQRIQQQYPDKVKLTVVESLPYAEYRQAMSHADIILDQLYSYTPSMNPLQAMTQGIICVGGGEPENYDIIHEKELRPIINVEPNEESVYSQLENLVLHPEKIVSLKQQSIDYVRKHHNLIDVAQQYVDFWKKM